MTTRLDEILQTICVFVTVIVIAFGVMLCADWWRARQLRRQLREWAEKSVATSRGPEMTMRLEQTVANWLAGLRKLLAGAAHPNRRREHRKPFSAPINVRTVSGVNYRGSCHDLSPLGMGALVSATLGIGERVRINYEHPALGEQNARATVMQRHGYRYGFALRPQFDV